MSYNGYKCISDGKASWSSPSYNDQRLPNNISEVHYAADNIRLVLPIQYTSKELEERLHDWERTSATNREKV